MQTQKKKNIEYTSEKRRWLRMRFHILLTFRGVNMFFSFPFLSFKVYFALKVRYIFCSALILNMLPGMFLKKKTTVKYLICTQDNTCGLSWTAMLEQVFKNTKITGNTKGVYRSPAQQCRAVTANHFLVQLPLLGGFVDDSLPQVTCSVLRLSDSYRRRPPNSRFRGS